MTKQAKSHLEEEFRDRLRAMNHHLQVSTSCFHEQEESSYYDHHDCDDHHHEYDHEHHHDHDNKNSSSEEQKEEEVRNKESEDDDSHHSTAAAAAAARGGNGENVVNDSVPDDAGLGRGGGVDEEEQESSLLDNHGDDDLLSMLRHYSLSSMPLADYMVGAPPTIHTGRDDDHELFVGGATPGTTPSIPCGNQGVPDHYFSTSTISNMTTTRSIISSVLGERPSSSSTNDDDPPSSYCSFCCEARRNNRGSWDCYFAPLPPPLPCTSHHGHSYDDAAAKAILEIIQEVCDLLDADDDEYPWE